jgi:heme exporter protein CcmB
MNIFPFVPKTCKIIFFRQLKLSFFDGATLLNAFIFLLLSVCVFHIAIGYHVLLPITALGILMVCVIFSLILACPSLIVNDHNDGTWEQFYLTNVRLEYILLSKILAQIFCYLILFITLSPLLFIIMQLKWQIFPNFLLAVSLLICITCFNVAFASTVSIGSNNNFLAPLLTLPLAIPGTIIATIVLHTPTYWLALLGLLMILCPVFILAGAFALKHALAHD